MEQSNTSEQQKKLDLQQGVYVIRYSISEDLDAHPTIKIKVDAGSENDIFLVLSGQDVGETILWRPGTSIAVRAQRQGRVLIEVRPVNVNSSTNATIKIDTLIQGENSYELFGERNTAAASASDFRNLKLHGHVAGRGDITVGGTEWLGGPGAPARIEGFTLEWPAKPTDIDIRYTAVMPRVDPRSAPMVRLGTFVGSRGRALPILGVNMELVGPGAAVAELVVETIFLSSPPVMQTGARINMAGPTGREPLVGLRVAVQRKTAEPIEAPKDADVSLETPARTASAGRVRVFRSRTKTSSA